MKLKLIVSLIALCLTLSIISVQAQGNEIGNMNKIDVIITGNTTETVTCNITGNAAVVESMANMTGNMTGNQTQNTTENQTQNMTGNQTQNMTGSNMTGMSNATEGMKLDMTGRMILVRDLSNMTEKAVIVGKMNNMPGTVVIFGKSENMTGNMTGSNMTGNLTVLLTGNMTGTFMLNNKGMNNTAGMNNMAGMDNMTVLMAGNMTGNITGDMTRKMVVIKNMGTMTEMAKTMSNMTGTAEGMGNTTQPMKCNMTGKMVIIKNIDNMTEIAEDMDKNLVDLVTMDGNMAVIGNIRDMHKMEGREGMFNIAGRLAIIRSMDGTTEIMNRNVTCNITQTTTRI
jgi:hypothetical protein